MWDQTKTWLTAVIALAFLIGRADGPCLYADTITLNSHNGDNVTVYYQDPSGSGKTYSVNATAGQFDMTYNASGGGSFNFYGFCVDLSHVVGDGTQYAVNPSTTNNPNFSNWPNYGSETNAHAIAYVVNKYGSGAISNNDMAAAVQMTIWTLLGDGANGLTSLPTSNSGGNNVWFSGVGNGAMNDANSILADVQNAAVGGVVANWYQDLYQNQPPQLAGQSVVTATPEPASMTLWAGIGLGCLAYGWGRHRLRDRSRDGNQEAVSVPVA